MAMTFASSHHEINKAEKIKDGYNKMPVNDSCSRHNDDTLDIKTNKMFPDNGNTCPPCLPVSKGCIKKTAQTRFVNSSPRSYRLMPASVESSDMTSFVEKSSHSHVFPRFFLDVAELWELSKRSELECNFTLARSEKISGSNECINEAKHKSPICHSSIKPCLRKSRKIQCLEEDKVDFTEEISTATLGRSLVADCKKFFESQELKESHPMGIAGFMKPNSKNTKEYYRHNAYIPMNRHKLFCNMKSQNDSEIQSQYALTPLVKRLSVSGLEDKEKNNSRDGLLHTRRRSFCNSSAGDSSQSPTKRAQSSGKRPSSSPKVEHNDEPLQKKANCINTNDPI
uniref:uncharacterized protein LOC120336909 n=1 Tax=Styela clava TaxID=7725 RepID=UPI00193A2C9E|nr:uncharacterized protein LOC120336909 [Styela clava]